MSLGGANVKAGQSHVADSASSRAKFSDSLGGRVKMKRALRVVNSVSPTKRHLGLFARPALIVARQHAKPALRLVRTGHILEQRARGRFDDLRQEPEAKGSRPGRRHT